MNISTEEAALIKDTMQRYGISEAEAIVSAERRKVYGDPEINHKGIAMAWAGLLQPWALRMARMDPLPPHVVALMMAALKNNRMRMKFHEDNFIDANVYAGFARAWQKEWDANDNAEKPIVIPPAPSANAVLRIQWVDTSAKPDPLSLEESVAISQMTAALTENRIERQLRALREFCRNTDVRKYATQDDFAAAAETVVNMTP